MLTHFSGTYTQLSRESGITLEHNDATELRHAILEGRWLDVSHSPAVSLQNSAFVLLA